MRKLVIIFITIFLSNICFAQASDFEKYKISSVGYICIPTKMEIQSGDYKKLSEIYKNELGKKYGYEISGNRVVFQQKGLNDFDKSGFSSYARVILETDIGSYGDYEKLTNNYTVTQAELNELNSELKSQIQQSFYGTGLKLIIWYGVSIAKVNGRKVLKISYLRQLKDNPYVVVNMYSFQNNDRVHRLTLSYRQSDEAIWKPLYSQILNSFTIINVR